MTARAAVAPPDVTAQDTANAAAAGGMRVPVLGAALAGVLVTGIAAAVSWGPVAVPVATVWRIVVAHLTGSAQAGTWTASQDTVVWDLRLPRALLGALVGAGLGVVGVVVQALVRNPLADPYLLGISSGASLSAVGVLVLGVPTVAGIALGPPVAAFLGALAAFALVWAIARRGGGLAPLRLVLAGVAVGYLLAGLTSYFVLNAGDEQVTRSVLFWLLGSLAAAQWPGLVLPAAALALGLVVLIGRARGLNALVMGDETAASLGVDVTRLRRELFVVTSLLTGVVVAVSGAIGFVGLVVPHAVRLVVRGDHRRVLPIAALTGAVLLVFVDIAARRLLEPQELPVGIVTSVLGAPLFLWLLDRRGRDGL